MTTDNKPEPEEERPEQYIRKKIFLSFSVFIIFILVAIIGWRWLQNQPREQGALKPLRKGLQFNEKVNAVFFSDQHLSKEYPELAAAKKVRVNGAIGLKTALDTIDWNVIIYPNPENSSQILKLTMKDILSLPARDIIFDFKCIEGWSQVSHWGGTTFSGFLKHYRLGTHSGNAPDPQHPEDLYKYVGLMTPDSAYYVGIDMKSMLHPQTILCYEMNGKPLPLNQGYPLRLIIPVKYGVKHLKRIGFIYFSDSKPKDYWFKKGYDYDCAL